MEKDDVWSVWFKARSVHKLGLLQVVRPRFCSRYTWEKPIGLAPTSWDSLFVSSFYLFCNLEIFQWSAWRLFYLLEPLNTSFIDMAFKFKDIHSFIHLLFIQVNFKILFVWSQSGNKELHERGSWQHSMKASHSEVRGFSYILLICLWG